jgi:hypothetical protein
MLSLKTFVPFVCFVGCGGADVGVDTFSPESSATAADSGTGSSSGTFGNGSSPVTPDGSSGEECTQMDIVFVVDNSASMMEEQASLKANFPRFIRVIEAYKTKQGLPLDFRVAVTNTDDLSDRGKFRTNGAVSRQWLERQDPMLSETFGVRAEMGTTGSPLEKPLETLKLALTDRIVDGTNGAFLRETALLAAVVLTDENVAGLKNKTNAEYIADFDAVKKGKRERWAFAAIAGPLTSTAGCSAARAAKLNDFTTAVGTNGVFASICDADLTSALEKAVSVFTVACKTFGGPIR